MAQKQPRPGAGLNRKVAKWFRCRAKGREQYAAADELLSKIRQNMKPGDVAVIRQKDKDGRTVKVVVRLVDLYQSQDKVFRSHGIARFDLVPVRTELA